MNIINKTHFASLKYFCVFIGYPRSGHSIIGSIIDAHPNACISHEYHALANYTNFNTKEDFFYELLKTAEQQANSGRQSYGYEYLFEGLSQGTIEQLQVIGDKRGSGTTHYLINDLNSIDIFQQFVELPLKIIHVTRNPYDIITTKASYHQSKKVTITKEAIQTSIRVLEKEALLNQQLIDSKKHEILSFAHESLILNPIDTIQNLFNYLELPIDQKFIAKIVAKIFANSNKSRNSYAWNSAEIEQVKNQILSIPIFSEYNYD